MSDVPPVIIEPVKSPLERDVEARLIRKVKNIGGISWKFVSPNNRGVADRIVLIEGNVFFVEVKRDGGRLTELQHRHKEAVIRHKGNYFLAAGYSGVDDFIDHLQRILLS